LTDVMPHFVQQAYTGIILHKRKGVLHLEQSSGLSLEVINCFVRG